MYENQTYENILQSLIDKVPSGVQKTEGSFVFDALAPAAAELAQAYAELDSLLNEAFADTASRPYLIRRAAERGITPQTATPAVLRGVFNVNVDIGARFSGDYLNYTVTEQIADGHYKLRCDTAGIIGNEYLGPLTPLDHIPGLTSAELTQVLIPGEDDEDVETLRNRYFSHINHQAYGGNSDDYQAKVNALDGVGGVKVYPVWNGGGTVKLVIINSSYGAASSTLVDAVQTAIDPVTNRGQGLGLAPIGHTVTVASAAEEFIDISLALTCQPGWTWADVESYVYAALDAYFLELNQIWAEHDHLTVRVSQIEIRLLDIEGILDVENITLNGAAGNYTVPADSIPARGSVSV